MIKLSKFLTIFIIMIVLGGFGFLAFLDIPAPSETVVKVIPDSRFPR